MKDSLRRETEPPPLLISKSELQTLIVALQAAGYSVIAPTIEQEAIVYAEIQSTDELPIGWRDAQMPGKYRLQRTEEENFFSFNVGPHSWKQFLFPPQLTVGTAERSESGWQFVAADPRQPKYAFLGVRGCELAAIAVQDRVFLHGPYVDPVYKQRRESVFIVAVNCTVAAATCFCTSMNTGPRCEQGFDLALTEIDDGFLVELGTQRGAEFIEKLQVVKATESQMQTAGEYRQRAVDQIDKRLETENIRDLLLDNLDHPHWDEVAERCLSCTNCTMVCPTCFCATVAEVTDLTGDQVRRERQWDSCFNIDFSSTADGTIRRDTRSRYRQWLTHKLASWHDQFDSSGCVGCGRCITWCPVGIDLTEEVAAIRKQPAARRSLPIVQSKQGTACAVRESAP